MKRVIRPIRRLSIPTISLFLGGSIYICFRSESILLFKWFDNIGLSNEINLIRTKTLPFAEAIPEWCIYSLPDGLWLFSYVATIYAIWGKDRPSNLWIYFIPVLAIFSEIGQLFSFVPGTFDPVDIVFYLLGTLTPKFFFNLEWNQNHQLCYWKDYYPFL